ncbi:hypothetical protein [Robiginitalea aurantiaca]|uniref:LTXXQ motif family protein n=1 Tax=Robiginitalea aurantiaca TaxID=3056915 RepID=A0ABT7WFA3_9FLAO|nr:hypothetical protein [Robiginitalea aurantiaca]MDM9631588.1 hypothetical protein [Robiginitalea aurantiaca]
MKKAIALCALLLGFGVHAQHKSQKHSQRGESQTQLSTAQQATIESKRMTLALGLDEQQQVRLEDVLKKHLDTRLESRENRKPEENDHKAEDSEERFARMNQWLDREIAFQKDLRGILTDPQFEAWHTEHKKKMAKRKHRSKSRRMEGPR